MSLLGDYDSRDLTQEDCDSQCDLGGQPVDRGQGDANNPQFSYP